MKNRRFALVKNIILTVASALTLIAVSFAWLTTNNQSQLGALSSYIGGEVISVQFMQKNPAGDFERMTGDIELDNFVAGSSNQYKMIVTTSTSSKLNLFMRIEDLPADLDARLANDVYIKYSLYSATKSTDNGVIKYTDKTKISESTRNISLSELADGQIFSAAIGNYQTSAQDVFVIYYEIGLLGSSNAQGVSSSLGSVAITATEG